VPKTEKSIHNLASVKQMLLQQIHKAQAIVHQTHRRRHVHTCAIPERLRGVITTRPPYTNPRISLPLPYRGPRPATANDLLPCRVLVHCSTMTTLVGSSVRLPDTSAVRHFGSKTLRQHCRSVPKTHRQCYRSVRTLR